MNYSFFVICLFSVISFGYISLSGSSADLQQINQSHFDFCSQASQDRFVYTLLYEILNKQDTGYYLDIGAGHPKKINNSYFLEKNLGWKGVSIEISDSLYSEWTSTRENPLLVEDATKSNYHAILQKFPRVIDYLSLDVDGSYDTILERIPFHEHIFKVLTIEHDFYRFGDIYRDKERKILSSLGYYLLCPDVSICENAPFEDWWIYPDEFPPAVFEKLKALDLKGKNYVELMKIIQANMLSNPENN